MGILILVVSDAMSKNPPSIQEAMLWFTDGLAVATIYENHFLCPRKRIKRPSGMSSLLGKIGAKKQKMSTLEKSKLDWESFKEEEGIGEELAIHNRGKEGYIERKAFLDRVDHRQFEIERDLRLSKMKP
ncbi:hypothetical protein STEG23_022402 [Scotinomys teguina]